MAWNEPGNKDPWGNQNKNNRQDGPPDLSEVFKKLTDRLSGQKKSGNTSGNSNGDGANFNFNPAWLVAGVAVLLILWSLTGIYTVNAGQRGVEILFGRYYATATPGLNWHFPAPLGSVQTVDVEQRRAEELGYRSAGNSQRPVAEEALMLTEDENIVDIRLAVQFRINDPKAYLFNVENPINTLREVVESLTREVIGKNSMDFVLTQGRSEVVAKIHEDSQRILNNYGAGLLITNVVMQDAQPPEEVQDAFADAIKAREDEQRLINESQAYSNEILPKARGAASRLLRESEGQKEATIAKAEGEASRFTQLLQAYQQAPEVTRERIYLETMQHVLERTPKALVDLPEGNQLMVLPLDSLASQLGQSSNHDHGATDAKQTIPALIRQQQPRSMPTQNAPLRDTSRTRNSR